MSQLESANDGSWRLSSRHSDAVVDRSVALGEIRREGASEQSRESRVLTELTSFDTRQQLKEVDGAVYEADAQMITIKEGEVDIGANA